MRRPATALLGLLLWAPSLGAIEPLETGTVATLPEVGDHWVWVPDRLMAHSLLFDGDTGRALATIDGGTAVTPKPPLFSRRRGEFYSVEIDYSRGRRGDRVDYVTVHDARTLEVTDEVVLPTRTSESNSSVAYTALLDGDRFLATFNQFPHTSVSIVDLDARRFTGEIVTAGCAGIYPTGERRFGMLCGDGSVLSVSLDEGGKPVGTAPAEPFFDAVADPVMMAGARIGPKWIFVSFEGRAHEVDFSRTPATAVGWSLLSDSERQRRWRPGGLQHVAVHRPSRRLYVVVHQGGPGSHKDPGPEVWVFDLDERRRVERFSMPNFTAAFLGATMGVESGGFVSWILQRMLPDPGAHTIAVTQDDEPLLFARSADRGVVAVLDARTGEHLRDLREAGLAGPTLRVP